MISLLRYIKGSAEKANKDYALQPGLVAMAAVIIEIESRHSNKINGYADFMALLIIVKLLQHLYFGGRSAEEAVPRI